MDRHLGLLFFFTFMALTGQVVVEPEIDTTAPIIQTWDYTSRHILVGDPFEDHGVTAWDETDGEIEVVLSGNLDTSTVGVYTQTYTATDSSGNTASESQTIFVVGSREELLVFIDNDDGQTTVLFTADPSIRGDLEVPATWQGKSVVEVNSLAWCDKLTSVTLPDSVTHLGYGAFQSCKRSNRSISGQGYPHLENGFSMPIVTHLPRLQFPQTIKITRLLMAPYTARI